MRIPCAFFMCYIAFVITKRIQWKEWKDGWSMERAILVGVYFSKEEKTLAESSLDELAELADTANATVVGRLLQIRDRIDSATFIGKGKVQELVTLMEETEANLVIFDDELSAAHVRNLERAIDGKILDRTQLILDIFASRANTKEGILQVDLAQLSYLLPRLAGQGQHLSRLGGGIGTRGPGETKLETDRRHIKRRISEVKLRLEDVMKQRKLSRARRKKNEVYQIALVGYTNAGKSTLLNRLTDAAVLEEDKLFATLDPTSRQLKLPSGKEVILTDTVGFIKKLPHDLVAAFRATLEEVKEADLILHVVDSHTPDVESRMKTVDEILTELGASQTPSLVVYNKIDLMDDSNMLPYVSPSIKISAYNEEHLNRLRHEIDRILFLKDVKVQLTIPAGRGDIISLVHRNAVVEHMDSSDESIEITARFTEDNYKKIEHVMKPFINM